MRVFVAGKGGVGKTTVTGALCAAIAEAGVEVIAIDADGSPNLALGLDAGDPEELPAVANTVPPAAADACDTEPLSGDDIIDRFSVVTPQGARLVQTGRIERPSDRCLCCGSHATAREVIAALPGNERQLVIADLEPGLNDLLWARPGPEDVVVVVTDASWRSLEVARRVASVARELGVLRVLAVANKVRPDEVPAIRSAFEGVAIVEVAYDPVLDRAVPDPARLPEIRELAGRLATSATSRA